MGLLQEPLKQRSPFEAASAEQTGKWPGSTEVVLGLPGRDSMVWFAWRGLGSPGSAGDPRNKAEVAVKFNYSFVQTLSAGI